MAKPLIPADAILAHALGILDAEGVEALTARRLSTDLKISPATLYSQVGNRKAMIRALVARHLSQLTLNFKEYDDWQSTALHWCLALRRALRAHPFLTELMTIDDRKSFVDYGDELLKVMRHHGIPQPLAIAACTGLTIITINHSVAVVRAQRDVEHSREIARELTKIDKNFPQLIGWVINGIDADIAATVPAQPLSAQPSPAAAPSIAKRQRSRAN
jgi:AcrR family transcriptional regulator